MKKVLTIMWQFIIMSAVLLSSATTYGQVSEQEKAALIALYNATGGGNWRNNSNWLSEEPVSNWYGVTVSENKITELDLHFNNLKHSIPTEIGNLTNLTNLILYSNELNGSIPIEIGNLTNLTNLNLRRNELRSIPVEIETLTNLSVLNIGQNQIETIPIEIGNLTNLKELSLHGNQISSIPIEIGNLTNLKLLNLNGNQISSMPDEIMNLLNLENLSLFDNQLSGSIPIEIGTLTSLNELRLGSNQLSGSIPVEIGTLTSLNELTLGSNQLSGSIPVEIGNLTGLNHLDLKNNKLSGSIPVEMVNLKILNLFLSNNHFTPDDLVTGIYSDYGRQTWQTILNPIPTSLNICKGSMINIDFSNHFQEITFNSESYDLYKNNELQETIHNTTPAFTVNSMAENNVGDYYIEWTDLRYEKITFKTAPIKLYLSNLTLLNSTNQINENTTNGTVIGQIQTNETFVEPIDYSINNGNINDAFAINSQGIISVNNSAALDYEDISIFFLSIHATDGKHSDDATVIISLNALNEFDPEISDTDFNIMANANQNTVIGSISATDADKDEILKYSITDGNFGNAFIIDELSGEISVYNTKAFDFQLNYNLIVEVNDGENSAKADVNIMVNAVQDTASPASPNTTPSRSGAISFVINDNVYIGLGENENGLLSDFVCYHSATDSWSTIDNFPGAARQQAVAFVIDNKAYVGTGIDENYTRYNDFYKFDPATTSWTKISDFGGTVRSGAVSFAIDGFGYVGTGRDDNDEQKDFWKYDPILNQWLPIADLDNDKRADAVAFVIEGKAYVSGGSYFDSYSSQLSDVMEYNPQTDSWTEKIFADGINLSFNYATVITVGNSAYICYGNKTTVVKYTPATNKVENLGDILDLQKSRSNPVSFILNQKAYFGFGKEMESMFEMNYMNDIQDFNIDIIINTTPIADNYSFSIHANIETNSQVGSVIASDSENDILIYSITDDNSDNIFSINQLNGTITVNNALAIDFNTTKNYTLTIEISDLVNITTSEVFIELSNSPEVDNPTFSIDENSENSTSVGTVTATDADGDVLTYSIISGNIDNVFAIDTTTGEITINDNTALDYETNPTFSLAVSVSDGVAPVEAIVTIQLNDITETGISSFSEIHFNCYPNPTSDNINIEMNETVDEFTLELYSLSGQKLISEQYSSSKASIQLPQSNSCYLLKVISGNNNQKISYQIVSRF